MGSVLAFIISTILFVRSICNCLLLAGGDFSYSYYKWSIITILNLGVLIVSALSMILFALMIISHVTVLWGDRYANSKCVDQSF